MIHATQMRALYCEAEKVVRRPQDADLRMSVQHVVPKAHNIFEQTEPNLVSLQTTLQQPPCHFDKRPKK